MQHDSINTQPIELTKEIHGLDGVKFDAERISLTGKYGDELSLFRAKRIWGQILEDNFLLEPNYDYTFSYYGDAAQPLFVLTCEFTTACGRYAFWRLTNNQAPEAQYMIETAHIPHAEARQLDFLEAPDMAPADDIVCDDNPEVERGLKNDHQVAARHWFSRILNSLMKD